jgi:tetratricopeptide (TPR) repeat protein
MKALFAALVLLHAALAQTPAFSVECLGRDAAGTLLRIEAADVPALDLLSRAASVLSVPLKVDPAILDDLARRTVSIHRTRIVLDELGLLLGIKLGVLVVAGGGALELKSGGSPTELAAAQALTHLGHALVGHADPELMPGLRYQRACLLLEAGAADEAATAFADLVRDFPGHALSAGARLLSIGAALRAGRAAEAMSLLIAIEESRDGLPPIPKAELLPARVFAAIGNRNEALLRARKVAATGRFPRDRVLAGLMAAEIQWGLRDGRLMLEALDGLPPGFERGYRDLVPKAALARGLALRILHEDRCALVHLRVAFRTIEDRGRPRVAGAISECLAALDEPVPAWLAVRQAEALSGDPAEVRRIQARRAELEESIGAHARSIETCVGLLAAAGGPFPEAERVLATLARCFLSTERFDGARAALEALADRDAWRHWALFQLALLERRAGDRERALRALARIEPSASGQPGPTADAVRTLRGELLLEIGDPLQAADVFRGEPGEGRR